MSYTFNELDGKKMTVKEFLEKKALLPNPLKTFITNNKIGTLIPIFSDSLNHILSFVGQFTVYEDSDGTVDHYVIIRKELWFIINLDEVE